ncbi:ABC transporter, ATP-binding protein [Mycoplasmopsis californica]|uniref:ABC transporter ATP-binding protein n=1 Tax=Mycoplasmopsis equigenitalium TaxID=114883 RepID=A0ABY5J1X3_9BACT|nr:ABC transporter ATP-binding protein [Mycoplasmopsis equigenitalium]UUD37243.1 ABC transporter ATP-binding protein [Mycoplasmopsis equigenitalium]VEU69449.1 ABC transporter, ATP-binding protein [Mycoplasmopsis californica]
MQNENIIQVKNLTKSFQNLRALDDLSFKVQKGQLYGFLGLNGAGKSTTLNIILGLVDSDSGQVEVDGLNAFEDIKRVRQKIGVVFQESVLDPELSVEENLKIRLTLYKKYLGSKNLNERLDEIVKKFELEKFLKRRYGKLSGGERRRVDIARSLIHQPKILFLDEPTTGLDPSSRKLVWSILNKIRDEDKLTILLTTHYMEEANNCDFITIIENGKCVAEGTPFDLKTKYSQAFLYCYKVNHPDFVGLLNKKGLQYHLKGDTYQILFKNFASLDEFFKENKEFISDYEVQKGNMDDVFLRVTRNWKEQDVRN